MSSKSEDKKQPEEASEEPSFDEVKQEQKLLEQKKICVVCGGTAEFCMRGMPENKYCKPCAKDYFKLLGYLDKLK